MSKELKTLKDIEDLDNVGENGFITLQFIRDAARENIKELEKIKRCKKCGSIDMDFICDECVYYCNKCDHMQCADGSPCKIEWIKHFFNLED